jgi:hypothetical protein
MSNFYYGSQHHSSHSNLTTHPHHAGRSRRATRASAAHHNHHKQMRALRLQKEAEESAMEKAWVFRQSFEAARSFDLEDDEMFCPFNLLTEDDVSSQQDCLGAASTRFVSLFSATNTRIQLHSMPSGSDRSSLSSGSPEQSPTQQQIQPTASFLLPPSTAFSAFQPNQKLHQPQPQRSDKAIPIVDPSTRSVASPPPSVSPARQLMQAQQFIPASARRVW